MTTKEFLNDCNTIINCCEETRERSDNNIKILQAESVAYNMIHKRFKELKDELTAKDNMVF